MLIAALAVAIVALAGLVVLEGGDRRRIILSSSYYGLLEEPSIKLHWDSTLKPLGLTLSIAVAVLLLNEAGRRGGAPRPVAGLLMMLATGLAALWAANPLTVILFWALYDLTLAVCRILEGDEREHAVRGLALGTGSGLLLWAGLLAGEAGTGNAPWSLMTPGGARMSYWMLAGFLRVGAYPLHVPFRRARTRSASVTGGVLLSPILAWGLWIRLAQLSDRGLSVTAWMVIPAMLTLVAGGLLAWTASSAREAGPWIGMGANGSVLVAAILLSLGRTGGGEETPVVAVMALGAMGWMLSTTMLLLGGGVGFRPILDWGALPRRVPSLIGSLSLVGVPATAGFVSEAFVLRELARPGRWGWRVGFLLGHGFLVSAVIRWLVAAEPVDEGGDGLIGETARDVGVASLAVSLTGIGVLSSRLLPSLSVSSSARLGSLLSAPGVGGWLLWVGALLLGGSIAWLDMRLRPRISLWLDVLHDGVLLDWGYELLSGAFEQGFGWLRVVDGILSGRSALLWACILLLILALVMGG